MNRTGAVCTQGLVVGFRAVALVDFKTIFRVLLRQLHHDIITGNLRQNGSRRNVGAEAVALHHSLHRQAEIRLPVAVNQGDFRQDSELLQRPTHSKKSRL